MPELAKSSTSPVRKPRKALSMPTMIAALALVLAWPALAQSGAEKSAATFSCNVDSSGLVYCVYSGPLDAVYVNTNHMILIYPDPSISGSLVQSEVDRTGFEAHHDTSVLHHYAFAIEIPSEYIRSTDPQLFHRMSEFADKAYAGALAAQFAGKRVNVQIRSAFGGWLEIDRIWISD